MVQLTAIRVKKEETGDDIATDFFSDVWSKQTAPEDQNPKPTTRQTDLTKKGKLPPKEEVEFASLALVTLPADQNRRKQRWFLDAVVVPTFRQVCRARARLVQGNIKPLHNGGGGAVKKETLAPVKVESVNFAPPLAIKNETKREVPLKKRKVKVKLEDVQFDDDISNKRYKAHGISPYPIPMDVGQDVYEVMVPRFFMCNVYGGNPVQVRPKISEEKLAEHGFNNFFFVALDAHPQAPRIPGSPGLFFSIGDDPDQASEPEPGILRVFTRIYTKPKALWQYQGQYQIRASESITKEEWARQTPEVRNTWISYLHTESWAKETRAAIYGRKTLGRKPTFDEIYDILEQGLDKSVTKEEIGLALTRGEQRLTVDTLKCVGYDADFQRHVIEKYQKWNPKDAKEKSKSGKKRRAKKADPNPAKKKRPRVANKSKDSEIETDSEESVIVLDDDDDDGGEQLQSRYIPKGTQSRPRQT